MPRVRHPQICFDDTHIIRADDYSDAYGAVDLLDCSIWYNDPLIKPIATTIAVGAVGGAVWQGLPMALFGVLYYIVWGSSILDICLVL